MKRKIALLLAAVMTMSMLPMNLFAASNNHFSKTPMTIPNGTVLFEEAFPGLTGSGGVFGPISTTMRTSGSALYEVPEVFSDNSEADYVIEGSNFVITPSDVIREGDTFRVKLENAVWFFRGMGGTATNANTTLATTIDNLNTSGAAFDLRSDVTIGSTESNSDWFDDVSKSDKEELQATPIYYTLGMTYDPRWGVWVPDETDSENGTYYRTNTTAFKRISNEVGQIPYKLIVSPLDAAEATIVIAGEPGQEYDPNEVGQGHEDIVIPLVTRANEDEDMKVSIQSSLTGVSSGTYIYGISGSGETTTTVKDWHTAREEFEIDKLVIKESRLDTLESNGSFIVKAPRGFTWANVEEATLHVDSGFSWRNSNTATGVRMDDDIDNDEDNEDDDYNANDIIHFLHYGTLGTTHVNDDNYMSERIVAGTDYAIGYDFIEDDADSHRTSNQYHDERSLNHYSIDEQTLVVSVAGLNPSTRVPGSMWIEGLTLLADEDAPFGDFNLSIKDYKDDELNVTAQTDVKAGKRVDYAVALTAKDAPTLISGRYETYNSEYFDDYQQAAHVTLSETASNSWWAGRQTILSLPKGVKYAQIEITNCDEIVQGDALEDGIAAYDGYYRNDGKKQGYVLVDGNQLTFSNLKVNSGEKGKIEMDVWVSMAADFSGDVVMKAEGTAITDGKAPSAVIAKALAPVTIETKATDVKIGYQYQKTENIKITETKAGNLLRGTRLNVSVTDLISSDVAFSPSTEVNVTDGDLKIKNATTIGSGIWNSNLGETTNRITFDIDRTSVDKASTITLSNVSVKVDRTVPESNDRPYEVVAWGSAIAKNFNTTSTARKDEFDVPGVRAPYIEVVTSATDRSDILTSEVRVKIGERSYTVNGKVNEMDAAAYISPKSNSTMVPLRFVAYAFGLSEEQVIWDGVNRTVTLIHPSRVVQFAIGSQMMLVNGAATTMVSPDGLAVSAEINGERSYVPFRALGNAFGIPVAWENGDTAVYNKGAGVKTGSTVNMTAVPATTPETTPAQ